MMQESVYDRFHQNGRLMPEGLNFVASWTESDLNRCFQLMETQNESLFEEWMMNWKDLIEFEIAKVMTGAEASSLFPSPDLQSHS